MKIIWILATLFILFFQAIFAQNTDGALISKESYKFPTFQQAVDKTFAELYASKEEYEKAVADKNFEFSKITYLSDGLKVKAYLYKPKRIKAKMPVIVFNRGGLVREDIAPELISIFHNLASEGFVVIAPMYRQSDGGEGSDEIGGSEVNDLKNIVPLIKSFDFVDAENLFLYGESRGAVMMYLGIKQKFPARAAAVFGAISDVEWFLRDNAQSFPPAALNRIWKDFDQNKEIILKTRSAIQWFDEIKIPLLIMHGGSDSQVSPLQSLLMAEKLQKSAKPYQLIIYAGDNHYLTNNRKNRDRETINWFKTIKTSR